MDATRFQTLLDRARADDVEALGELLTGMRTELRRVVRATRRQRRGLSLRSTELFNEAYLKLFRSEVPGFTDQEHLLAMWSNATSWVVIEAWRRKGRRPELDAAVDEVLADQYASEDVDPERVQRAFEALKREMPREGLAAELRLLAGHRTGEIAEALEVSEPTVRRWVRAASSWIRMYLDSDVLDGAPQAQVRDLRQE